MASIEDLATKSERSSPLGIVGGRQQSSDDVKEALLTTQKTGALAKLQEILSNIGVGGFHWRLMAICGFGWMADNVLHSPLDNRHVNIIRQAGPRLYL
eukprot:1372976-Amorphochlora_amoeboformis.AAC.1